MRLNTQEQQVIYFCVSKKDPEAQIYLYGSRTKDNLKGGDIDLLVISEALSFSHKIDLLVEIKSHLGEQKIDLTILTLEEAKQKPFFQEVLKEGVKISKN